MGGVEFTWWRRFAPENSPTMACAKESQRCKAHGDGKPQRRKTDQNHRCRRRCRGYATESSHLFFEQFLRHAKTARNRYERSGKRGGRVEKHRARKRGDLAEAS